MIVYPQGLITSAVPPLDRPRIGWQNFARFLPSTSVTASTEALSAPKDAVLRPDTGEFWQATALPATLTIDLGATRLIDYVGVVANLNSAGADITIDYDSDPGFPAPFSFASSISPPDDTPLMFLAASQQSGRYLRLTFSGAGDIPIVSVVYVGVALAMEKQMAPGFTPTPLARETVLNQAMSEGGQFLGQSFRRNGTANAVSFKYLDPAWVRAYFDQFSKSARAFPYFFAWDPLNQPYEVGYVWTGKDIKPRYDAETVLGMSVDWEMQGVGSQV